LLCPYRENKVNEENYIRLLPDIEEGEEVYEVEQILKHRKCGQDYKYLIKWVGYLITKALWEPKLNLTGATDILQEYQELHQL
jgi:Chromo (CHRromatin Organisation MOdifier) domain